MSRGLNSTSLAALSAKEVEIYFAVDMDFFSGQLSLWSGIGPCSIDNTIYTGGGAMLGLSRIDETLEISARGAQVSLSGVPRSATDALQLAFNENYQGRIATIKMCVLDADNPRDLTDITTDHGSVFDTIFTGFMDVMEIDEGAETSKITVSIESRLIKLKQPVNTRFTDQQQKRRFPNDKGLEFTTTTPLQKIRWGR